GKPETKGTLGLLLQIVVGCLASSWSPYSQISIRSSKMSRYGGRVPNDCKVYVGDLPKDASEKEVEKAFSYYGRLRSVWVARNPPGFAFVEFEDYRDAEDSVKELDGTTICGVRVRVELSSGKVRPKPWLRGSRGPPRSRRAFNPDDRCYECGDRGHYAYDCPRNYRSKGGAGHSRGSRRSRSYSRSYSRSRSRDRRRDSRSKSRSHGSGRSRSRSAPPKSRSRSRSRSRSQSAHSN
ncbi:hypothetical protein EGW08_007889, partial [Elysia chlorotica]